MWVACPADFTSSAHERDSIMLYTTDFSGPVFNGPSWVVRNYLEKKGKTARKVWKLKKKDDDEKKEKKNYIENNDRR